MSLRGHEFVFGYGSLTALADGAAPPRTPAAGGFTCDLRGHRRRWGVAMDNRRDLPGYKHYTDAAGARPAVFVCFLDIVVDRSCAVNGLCVPVEAARLKELDARERNYERRDVSALVDAGGARVWAYVGRPAARRRMRRAAVAGRAVIDAGYLAAVTRGFRALGVAEWDACAPSLEPGVLPVMALMRHDHV